MKQVIKVSLIILISGLALIITNIIYLYRLAPDEVYSEDTFLMNEKNRSALIIVAHDDDASTFSGTTSLLAQEGWDVSFVCFYSEIYRPEDNPLRRLEMEKVSNIQGLKEINLIDFTPRKRLDTVSRPWLPIPYNSFNDNYYTDSLTAYISAAIEKYNPSVVFTLDKVIGGYGHPEHVLVCRVIENICNARKDSLASSVKKIYQYVMPPSQAEKVNGSYETYIEGKKIYGCNGMPVPDVQIDISPVAKIKRRVFFAHASQHRNLKKYFPFYRYYPGSIYFGIFDKEYFSIIEFEHPD